jgi:perosamine synthetase
VAVASDPVRQETVPPFALRFSEPVIRQFKAACEEIVRSGILTLGAHTIRFEALIAEMAGVADAVAVTSGTTALGLAFEALGLKNSLILIPANTNAATAAAAVRGGHRVRFYDAGLWATAAQVEAALDDQVAAVVIVHIGGFVSPEARAIRQLCRAGGIVLVEDAAHAHGAAHGAPAGSFGDAAAFSFFPTKVVTTAEGGVVATSRPDVAETVRRLRNQGQGSELIGGSYRLSEFSAALGVAQMDHLADWVSGQSAVFARYTAALSGVSGAVPVPVPAGGQVSGYKFVAIAESPGVREKLRAHMLSRGVRLAGGVYETLLTDDRRFLPYTCPGPCNFPAAGDFAARHFCLPAWPALTEPELDLVTSALGSFNG